jgi:hypothetical protein
LGYDAVVSRQLVVKVQLQFSLAPRKKKRQEENKAATCKTPTLMVAEECSHLKIWKQ